jgi:hypothetical protein
VPAVRPLPRRGRGRSGSTLGRGPAASAELSLRGGPEMSPRHGRQPLQFTRRPSAVMWRGALPPNDRRPGAFISNAAGHWTDVPFEPARSHHNLVRSAPAVRGCNSSLAYRLFG